jgi:c-di-GMP-related signal transduction protein
LLLARLGADKPRELIRTALVRAKMCEFALKSDIKAALSGKTANGSGYV